MHRPVVSAVVVGLLLAGTARADSGWREIRGPHVMLRTDLGSGAAKEAAQAVERFRAQVIAAAWPRATLPAADRVEVTVFGNGLEFEHHFGRNIAGVFFHDVPPFAVMYGHPDKWEHRASLATPETTSILRHELVHHPYDPFLLDTLAAVQALAGRCSEAAATQARALDALPEGMPASRRRDFAERLERYRTRCTSGAPATAGGG